MIERYEDEVLKKIWSLGNKYSFWQITELAVIRAMALLGQMKTIFAGKVILQKIQNILTAKEIDERWIDEREKDIKHDLNAFLDERLRHLPPELQQYLHKRITSFDTEESAFVKMLQGSCELINALGEKLNDVLRKRALRYRHTIMNGRTHGQEAELQTEGKRNLCWHADLRLDLENLNKAMIWIRFSKISGAIGTYGGINPKLEQKALAEMGLKPYYGATQIMPREAYAPLAQALCQIVQTMNKIALTIRLGARSGRPIYQESFGKKQKGSSAMPHKKNTISCEQIEGMARMALGFSQMIQMNIPTWEERAIEQSSVERVAWPDLFHVTARSLKVIHNVLNDLIVFPDNMLAEIVESRGCYASGEAKELLKEFCQKYDADNETAYRIVQLAAFNAFNPSGLRLRFRAAMAESLDDADNLLNNFKKLEPVPASSIKDIIMNGRLDTSDELEATADRVLAWNEMLNHIFRSEENQRRWIEIFKPSFLLRNEAFLYEKILG
ncbi:MAG: lyase family protein [bacterium]|nr:lyase family protein [bacterium]